MSGTIRLLNQVHGNSPPSAKRREHPEVRRRFNAHGHAADFSIAGARSLGGAAVVGEQVAGDGRSDRERGQTGCEHHVAGCSGQCAGPGEYGQDDEPGGEFWEVCVHGVRLKGTGGLWVEVVSRCRGGRKRPNLP